jgi:hypothetical protein
MECVLVHATVRPSFSRSSTGTGRGPVVQMENPIRPSDGCHAGRPVRQSPSARCKASVGVPYRFVRPCVHARAAVARWQAAATGCGWPNGSCRETARCWAGDCRLISSCDQYSWCVSRLIDFLFRWSLVESARLSLSFCSCLWLFLRFNVATPLPALASAPLQAIFVKTELDCCLQPEETSFIGS